MHTCLGGGSPSGTSLDLLLVLHVDDFLVGRSARGLQHFSSMMKFFKTGSIYTLTATNLLKYLGINITLSTYRHIVLSQHEFISRLRMVEPNRFGRGGSFSLHQSRITKGFVSILRNMIWVPHNRFAVSYRIARFSTSIAYRCDPSHNVLAMAALANKINRTLQTRPTASHYVPIFDSVPSLAPHGGGGGLGMSCLSDCGFPTLHLHRSVESPMILLGRPLRRDGEISIIGNAWDFSFRKTTQYAYYHCC